MRVQTRPLEPFWEIVMNALVGLDVNKQGGGCKEVRMVRRVEAMNKAIKACLEERRRW